MDFKGLFWKEPAIEKPIVSSISIQKIAAPQRTIAHNVGDTSEFDKHLEDVMEKAKLPFNDFYKSLNELNGQAIPIATKYTVVFTPLHIQGLTKEKLIATGNSTKILLAQEEKDFKEYVNGLEAEQVTKPLAQVEKLKSAIEVLTKQINDNAAKIDELTKQAEEGKSQIETKTNGMSAAISAKTALIDEVLTNINTYLK